MNNKYLAAINSREYYQRMTQESKDRGKDFKEKWDASWTRVSNEMPFNAKNKDKFLTKVREVFNSDAESKKHQKSLDFRISLARRFDR